MPLTMYRASIAVFVRGLGVMSVLLDKAEAHAKEKGMEAREIIGAKLIEDMLSFGAQIQRASDTSKMSAARLAGVEAPRFEDDEQTFAALQERLARTIAFLNSIDARHLDGSDTRPITLKLAHIQPVFSGEDYLFDFGLPNFYFHVVTAHDILRHLGVQVGKIDYLGPLA
jgi:uncharacterized protein